jgi:hypothetical protein
MLIAAAWQNEVSGIEKREWGEGREIATLSVNFFYSTIALFVKLA